ncbi:uncharacterized protein LOC115449191 [Manduca sexta]|uniref:uncharacterized protein LOC115449191 n=1 Tax=Manduca sexta TaxID=7130 RepID=UPI0011825825|nr:uncharacterized protein LOC115449191 [Manduca sexta]
MASFYLSILFISCCTFSVREIFAKKTDNYGPYVAKWKDYGTCKGPKPVNSSSYSTCLLVEKNSYIGIMNFTFNTSVALEQVRIKVYSIKADSKTLLWNHRMDKPCQHIVMAEILKSMFGINDCILKGSYYWRIDFTDCTYKYLGTSFFYGEYVFKLAVMSKKGNIACLFYNPVFMKKD